MPFINIFNGPSGLFHCSTVPVKCFVSVMCYSSPPLDRVSKAHCVEYLSFSLKLILPQDNKQAVLGNLGQDGHSNSQGKIYREDFYQHNTSLA